MPIFYTFAAMNGNITFTVGLGRRLMLFICMVAVGLVVASFVMLMLGNDSTPKVRIGSVVQDVVAFALPAVGVAVMVTRRPADLLMLRRPAPQPSLLMIAALLAAVPAMNVVIDWNASWPLSPGLTRLIEAQHETIAAMFGGSSAGSLIAALLIIGVMAPLTEELLFRGCLQRIMGQRVNRHVAIWTAAAVFSLAHIDPSGLVPRLLLGACFGYAMVWSGSLWTAVALHAVNNCLAVTSMWLIMRGEVAGAVMERIGQGNPLLASLSALITGALVAMAYRQRV